MPPSFEAFLLWSYFAKKGVCALCNGRVGGALGLLQEGNGALHLALLNEGLGQVELGRGEVGVELQGGLKLSARGRELALLSEDLAEKVVGLRGFGVGSYGFFCLRFCVGDALQLEENDRVIGVGGCVGLVELNRLLQMKGCLLPIAIASEETAEIGTGVGVVGIEFEGGVEG